MLLATLISLGALHAAPLQDSQGFERVAQQVREEVLPNGLRVIVLERGDAPVAAFRLYVRTGAMDEVSGQTGLAHFAEHMAFKGSDRIGSLDWKREQKALEAADRAWAAYEEAATAPAAQRDAAEVERLRAEFEAVRAEADALVRSGAFDQAVEEAGGLDQNAGTGVDSTVYYVSLPANRMEQYLWLLREQIGAPVMREFYKERDVVMEERRMRTDSNPFGALLEAMTNAAFVAHPYRDSTIGHMDDLKFLDRPEMEEFWKRHYTADRMVLAVVGKIDPDRVFRLARKYLSDLPAGAQPRPRRTEEPPQKGERIVKVVRPAAPMAILAWKCPSLTGRNGLVYDALGEIVAEGPWSRMYKRLVKEERAATSVQWGAGFPGSVDPTLFVVLVRPAPGHSLAECVALVQEEMDRLAGEGPAAKEMQGMRRRAKMALLSSLETNMGLADGLVTAEAEDGGWEKLFRSLAELEGIGPDEIARAAAGLTVSQRTTGYLMPPGTTPETVVE